MKRWGYEALKEIDENNKSKDKNSNKKKKSKEESKKKKRKNSTDDEKSSDEDSVDSLVFQYVSSQILKCQISFELYNYMLQSSGDNGSDSEEEGGEGAKVRNLLRK